MIEAHKNLQIYYFYNFIQYLIKDKFIIDKLTEPDVLSKFMGFCKYPDIYRIDIRFMPYDSYYTALLYFTGSANFNKKMRKQAIKLGYLLSEYGLYKKKTDEQININSENDVFKHLKMEYVEPNKR